MCTVDAEGSETAGTEVRIGVAGKGEKRKQASVFIRVDCARSDFFIGIGLFVLFAFVSLLTPSSAQNEIKITVQSDDPRIVEMIKSGNRI